MASIGTLFVLPTAGRGLFNVSANPLSKMDPFVRVTLGNTKHQTDVADNGHAAPQWTKQAPLAFPVSSRPDKSERSIQIDVIHKGFLSEKQVGYNLEVSIAPVLKRGASTRDHPGFDEWVEIRTVAGKAGGEIRLSLWFEPNAAFSASQDTQPQGIDFARIASGSSVAGAAAGASPGGWKPPADASAGGGSIGAGTSAMSVAPTSHTAQPHGAPPQRLQTLPPGAMPGGALAPIGAPAPLHPSAVSQHPAIPQRISSSNPPLPVHGTTPATTAAPAGVAGMLPALPEAPAFAVSPNLGASRPTGGPVPAFPGGGIGSHATGGSIGSGPAPYPPMAPNKTGGSIGGGGIPGAYPSGYPPVSGIGMQGTGGSIGAQVTGGGYPPQPAVGGYPPVPGPIYGQTTGGGGYPPQPAAGGYPPIPAAGGYPPIPAAGGYPPQPAAGGYPPQTTGGYPPAGAIYGQATGGYPPQGQLDPSLYGGAQPVRPSYTGGYPVQPDPSLYGPAYGAPVGGGGGVYANTTGGSSVYSNATGGSSGGYPPQPQQAYGGYPPQPQSQGYPPSGGAYRPEFPPR